MSMPSSENLQKWQSPKVATSLVIGRSSALLGPFYGSTRALKGCYNTQERQTQERQDFWVVVSFSLSERFGLGVGAGRFAVATSRNSDD